MTVGQLRLPTLCIAACLLATSAWAQTETTLQRISKKGSIVLAHRESAVPFSYLDADKKPIGYALDLCQKLAEAVRKKLTLKAIKVEYLMVAPAERIPAIVEGRADMECGATTNNAERREKVAFTIPHFITGARFLIKSSSPMARMEDFSGRKVASTKGSTPLQALERLNRERGMGIQTVEVPDHAKGVELVRAGEVDAFAMDDVQLYGLIAKDASPKDFKVVGQSITAEALAIMLPKGDAEFKKVIDDEMKRLILSGEIYPIYDKWFNKPIPPNGKSLSMPVGYLLKDFWKYPSDFVPF
ncbi:amino acid ABC transporter substrate-binding protein [Curvibacter sp. CHRR-16]|uniref:amino acid ABC transporter substrate-binding protein n=1 Tax=Curvibacter sp. CHRR-16 TaxID=2835872 RepID=UPI001BD9A7CE|nr:amino acid ABC transporter substrate-binding protein [Curvibacter sp. CHRR-16]MBT0569754.1 amino acid ABC transporter substrate-binding protein [Curvibacter sp. CHRR-16]